jgi:thioredoxin-related protein
MAMRVWIIGFWVLWIFPTELRAQVPVSRIPDFTFFRFDHATFSSKEVPKNRKTFFMFFDPECDHCQRAMAYIDSHHFHLKAYSLYLIALEDTSHIKFFFTKYAPHLMGLKNVRVLRDENDQFIHLFHPRKYPSMFIFSEKGKLLHYTDDPDSLPIILK